MQRDSKFHEIGEPEAALAGYASPDSWCEANGTQAAGVIAPGSKTDGSSVVQQTSSPT